MRQYKSQEQIESVFRLRDGLDAKGLNFTSFARKYGYSTQYLSITIWEYWQTGKQVRGLKKYQMLKNLERETGQSYRPPPTNGAATLNISADGCECQQNTPEKSPPLPVEGTNP
jgi:hypothetical protein